MRFVAAAALALFALPGLVSGQTSPANTAIRSGVETDLVNAADGCLECSVRLAWLTIPGYREHNRSYSFEYANAYYWTYLAAIEGGREAQGLLGVLILQANSERPAKRAAYFWLGMALNDSQRTNSDLRDSARRALGRLSDTLERHMRDRVERQIREAVLECAGLDFQYCGDYYSLNSFDDIYANLAEHGYNISEDLAQEIPEVIFDAAVENAAARFRNRHVNVPQIPGIRPNSTLFDRYPDDSRAWRNIRRRLLRSIARAL